VISGLLDRFYPERSITVTSSDLSFVTPDIKALLRWKNRLMHKGCTEEAGAVAARIGKILSYRNSIHLRKATMKNSFKEIWAVAKSPIAQP